MTKSRRLTHTTDRQDRMDDKESEEFYDYALINPQDCSKAVAESLKKGIELYGERELYGFLQAYSS